MLMRLFVIFAAVAAAQSRWAHEFAAARSLLLSHPNAKTPVENCISAAQKFDAAGENDELREPARQEYEACLPSLGSASARFFGRNGGLGKVTQDILGAEKFLGLLSKVPAAEGERAGLASTMAEAFYNAKEYDKAVKAAQMALKLNPSDASAFAILKLAQGRSGTVVADAITTAQSGANPNAGGNASTIIYSKTSKKKTPAPPSLLNPSSPDFWDKQLLAPMIAQSDLNPVSRTHLSPLLKSGGVTFRLVRVADLPANEQNHFSNAWGTYDMETSTIRFNLDAINADRVDYNSFYSKQPAKQVSFIAHNKPLDPQQMRFITERYMPLTIHEAGGHGNHGADLRKLLQVPKAPYTKETEILAFRLAAAYIVAERRKNPYYLADKGQWAKSRASIVQAWNESQAAGNSKAMVTHIDNKGYLYLPEVHNDPKNKISDYSKAISGMHGHCRGEFSEDCEKYLTALLPILWPNIKAIAQSNLNYLKLNPHDTATRLNLVKYIGDAVLTYRLDAPSAALMKKYYSDQDEAVSETESLISSQ